MTPECTCGHVMRAANERLEQALREVMATRAADHLSVDLIRSINALLAASSERQPARPQSEQHFDGCECISYNLVVGKCPLHGNPVQSEGGSEAEER